MRKKIYLSRSQLICCARSLPIVMFAPPPPSPRPTRPQPTTPHRIIINDLPISSINGAIRNVTPTSSKHMINSRQAVAMIVHLARCGRSSGSITCNGNNIHRLHPTGKWKNLQIIQMDAIFEHPIELIYEIVQVCLVRARLYLRWRLFFYTPFSVMPICYMN